MNGVDSNGVDYFCNGADNIVTVSTSGTIKVQLFQVRILSSLNM